MNEKPKILIIYTGGTIGMIENPKNHALEPFDFSHLMQNVPKVKMLDYDIDHYEFPDPIDSSNVNPQHWSAMASVIEANYEKFDGFVVLHGTDTMAYTASALSFMLENLDKPVIITGSQLPIGEVRTDGEENLITALEIAAARDDKGEQMVREVAILFDNDLLRGNRSTKFSSDNFKAFRSINYPSLAHVGLAIEFHGDSLWRNKKKNPLVVHKDMDPAVMYIDLFPGISEPIFRHLLSTPDVKGIVLKTYGAGNGPTETWFHQALKDAIKKGMVVINVSQCVNGSVLPKRYESGLGLYESGVIPGHDLTAEAAITKLMYLFGSGMPHDEVRRLLERPLRGELSLKI